MLTDVDPLFFYSLPLYMMIIWGLGILRQRIAEQHMYVVVVYAVTIGFSLVYFNYVREVGPAASLSWPYDALSAGLLTIVLAKIAQLLVPQLDQEDDA